MGAAAVAARIEHDTLLAKFYERLGQDAAANGDFKTAVHYRALAISFVRRACTVIEHSLHELRVVHARPAVELAAGARLRADARPRGAGRPAARRTVATRAGPDDDPEPASSKPRHLRLVKGAVYAYGCGPCPHCGASLMLYRGGLYCSTHGCPWGQQ